MDFKKFFDCSCKIKKSKKCKKCERKKHRNTILIVFDELTNYANLPKEITNNLKGYQLFKKIGVEFNNMQTSRQQCTPSRSTIMTGIYDTGLQDNIDYNYQYDYIPRLPTNLETNAKAYKNNKYDVTAYYGKQHLDTSLATSVYDTPLFCTATTSGMKQYGYDKFNVYGDIYYQNVHGFLTDNQTISYIMPPNSTEYDYYSKKTKMKYSGIIPFIKARMEDKKSWYVECHITNPHDTNHYYQNISQTPSSVMNQFPTPFIEKQAEEADVPNPYYLNADAPNAVPQHSNLLKNYFESNYNEYKTNKSSLPFYESYEYDYVISPNINSYNPFFIGTYYALTNNMTLSESQSNVKDWKNMINNYYGLLFEADSYLEKLYNFFDANGLFETTNILIIADHGDQLSAHGLKQKQVPFKECSNVPCIIYSPDLSCKIIGKSSSVPCSLVDIFPTQATLNNLKTSNETDGKSLLVWDKDKLKINYCEHKYYNPVCIVDSTMYALGYFMYLIFEVNNKNLDYISRPKNFFEYQSSYVSIITTINGIKYKFGRYYSINSIISYFLTQNPTYDTFTKVNLLEFLSNSDLVSKVSAIEYFDNNFPVNFSFQDGLNILDGDFTYKSNYYLFYYYYSFIAEKLNAINNYKLLVPGCNSSWEENYNSGLFSYFLYDLTNDANEIKNLFDPKYIADIDIELKEGLNNILNYSQKEKNCAEIKTILPVNIYLQLAELLYILGSILYPVNIVQNNMDLLTTLAGTSVIDGFVRPQTTEFFNRLISIFLLNLKSRDYINPSYIFNAGNNIYYVGETPYIEFLFNSLPYFAGTIFNSGNPDLTGLTYITIDLGIFSNLTEYKII